MLRRLLILTISTSLLFACEPVEITADLPDKEQLIVINGFFVTDSLWDVNLTYSTNINESLYEYHYAIPARYPITDATVRVFEEDQLHAVLEYRNDTTDLHGSVDGPPTVQEHHYVSANGPAVAGKTYSIEVTTPGGQRATASCKAPFPSTIVEAKLRETVYSVVSYRFNGPYKTGFGFSVVPDELTIDDPAGDNYYEIMVQHVGPNGGSPFPAPLPLFTNDANFHNTGLPVAKPLSLDWGEEYYSVLFADRSTEPRKLNATFAVPVVLDNVNGEVVPDPSIRYRIILRTLSKEYFQYKATQEVQANGRSDPFGQPVVIFGNVDGGLGIFAGMSQSAIEIGY